ncbi:hypothetical protein DPMN_003370 [Dreissena polymorpha]|uniref:Uncharacterized protein n=1 Tax=Dreissena polymorpha TaxID=45954 RepID=A0A9D4RUV3_DREPO|nr:hypothetical protein DPMN_003370 [Dreissena polymorpha]
MLSRGFSQQQWNNLGSQIQYLKHNHFPADWAMMEIPKNTKIPSRGLLPCPVSTPPRSQTPPSSTMPRNHRGVN